MHEEVRPVSDQNHILICGDGEDHSANERAGKHLRPASAARPGIAGTPFPSARADAFVAEDDPAEPVAWVSLPQESKRR